MKQFLSLAVTLFSIVVFTVPALAAGPYKAHPEAFNPDAVPVTIVAEWKPGTGRAGTPDAGKSNHGLTLGISDTVLFPPGASADATITPVVGDTLATLGMDHLVASYCTNGSPRYSVELSNGGSYAFGCASGLHAVGGDGWETITFQNGDVQVLGGPAWPGFSPATGETLTFLQLLQDEEGTTVVDNLVVNGVAIKKPGNNF